MSTPPSRVRTDWRGIITTGVSHQSPSTPRAALMPRDLVELIGVGEQGEQKVAE
jgi:hypothetical protein